MGTVIFNQLVIFFCAIGIACFLYALRPRNPESKSASTGFADRDDLHRDAA